MAYVTISQSEINPDSQIVDTVFSRMRDNWIAIKDGEIGAPRIVTQALYPPTSGYKWAWEYFSIADTLSGEWVIVSQYISSYFYDFETLPNIATMQAWRTGTYHFWISLDRSNTSSSSSVAVYRNGVRHSAIYTIPAGTGYQLFVFGLSFNAGDYFDVRCTSVNPVTVGVLGGMVDKPFAYIG